MTVLNTHPLPYKLHLAIAPTKNINRLEWFLEKATEIGIHKITPLACEHSERKVIKPERLEKIIIAALKQSQQFYLPEACKLQSFNAFEDFTNPKGFIAHCQEGFKKAFSMLLSQGRSCFTHWTRGRFFDARSRTCSSKRVHPRFIRESTF